MNELIPSSWSIRRKLVLGYVTAIILAFIGGALGLWALDTVLTPLNPFIALAGVLVVIGLEIVLVTRLRATINKLELQMSDRTKKMEVVIDISQRLSAILDLTTLMQEVVTITKDHLIIITPISIYWMNRVITFTWLKGMARPG